MMKAVISPAIKIHTATARSMYLLFSIDYSSSCPLAVNKFLSVTNKHHVTSKIPSQVHCHVHLEKTVA